MFFLVQAGLSLPMYLEDEFCAYAMQAFSQATCQFLALYLCLAVIHRVLESCMHLCWTLILSQHPLRSPA